MRRFVQPKYIIGQVVGCLSTLGLTDTKYLRAADGPNPFSIVADAESVGGHFN